ncbi:MOSC domain-containing protein [Ilumatobacter sp.]|uniref:MOSC domain-containing protein n=1 Tax=Ilumatobacter sp. TaxID=1967498 RepID=UPI003B51BD66
MTAATTHLSIDELTARQGVVDESPAEVGTVEMIVRRPDLAEREELDEGELVVGAGLVGDDYLTRGSRETPDGAPHPEAQLNLMSSRSIDLVAGGDRDRWKLAGDQFFVDFDLSTDNAPTGTRIAIGAAVIEVAAKPHRGCAKFTRRFGVDASRWVNSDPRRRFRGVNAIVVVGGVVRPGDAVRRLGPGAI